MIIEICAVVTAIAAIVTASPVAVDFYKKIKK